MGAFRAFGLIGSSVSPALTPELCARKRTV